MNTLELLKLSEKYATLAQKNYYNYQENGDPRYDRTWRKYDQISEAAKIAAEAADKRQELVSLRCDLTNLGYQLRRMLEQTEPDPVFKSWARNFLAVLSTYDLLRSDWHDS